MAGAARLLENQGAAQVPSGLELSLAHPIFRAALLACALGSPATFAQDAGKPVIEFVNIGGNDCPPCVAWRAVELPKLHAMPEWQLMKYHYVTKSIQAPVPSAFFFPASAKHLQPALHEASNGWSGSPQQAIVVNGKVLDYWYGTWQGDASQVAAMVRAIHEGKPLPRKVCAQLDTRTTCKKPA
jgi:hypothetical protein